MSKVRAKLEEYRSWGVRHVWLVDPYEKRMYNCEAGLTEVGILRAPEVGVDVTPADIFE
jgi:Uma2 family endonuclease